MLMQTKTLRSTKGSGANGRRVDGIIALINALGGSMSTPEETNESYYNRPDAEFTC
jgi:phage terminase large subunit-like protein